MCEISYAICISLIHSHTIYIDMIHVHIKLSGYIIARNWVLPRNGRGGIPMALQQYMFTYVYEYVIIYIHIWIHYG